MIQKNIWCDQVLLGAGVIKCYWVDRAKNTSMIQKNKLV